MSNVSIVIPAKNEAEGLKYLLPKLIEKVSFFEIIVVDDGSTDNTADVAVKHGAKVVSHQVSMGNGAAIKSGARAAAGDVLVFMDADGQHSPVDVVRMLELFDGGYDMVVGARSKKSQASSGRRLGNSMYNFIASHMVGHRVDDLTSGLRVVDALKFKEFLFLLPNGFSYPTTITMAFFRAGYRVAYCPINTAKRIGKSHLKIIKDGFRFLIIIFKVTTLYSPLKIFFPMSMGFFITGLLYYFYTYLTVGRFTNMSALLLICSMLIFMMGLISEQVTTLLYKGSNEN